MKLLPFLLLALISNFTFGQDPVPPNDLYGEDLKNWLRLNWYQPWTDFLTYTEAREEMYSYIDNEGGKVYCVYSGYNQNSAFTSFLDPINCEHTVPQSFFNELEPMKSDIHHLYPTHGNVNSARGNLPFDELNDNSTDTWFVGDESDLYDSSSIPSVSIDSYSELIINVGFEPREDHKGDLARSVFYFYTMYPFQAGSIEELAEIDLLYDWHIEDPVDTDEYTRDEKIQEVQGNYNPYVRDPELLGKAWGFITPGIEEQTEISLNLIYDPLSEILLIDNPTLKIERILVYSSAGALVIENYTNSNRIETHELNEGIYLISVETNSRFYSGRILIQ